MKKGNIFTYPQSELEPISEEIEGEIAELDYQINNLVTKSNGHYLALEKLAETLSDGLDNCELNLNSIQIVSDGTPSDATTLQPCSLKDLSLDHKKLIYWCAKTNSTLLKLLSDVTGKTPENIADRVGDMNSLICTNNQPSETDVQKIIDLLIEADKSNSNVYFQRI